MSSAILVVTPKNSHARHATTIDARIILLQGSRCDRVERAGSGPAAASAGAPVSGVYLSPRRWVGIAATLPVPTLPESAVLLPQPPFGFALVQVVWSILCYPVVVFLSRVVLDLYKPAMGEVDSYGRRL